MADRIRSNSRKDGNMKKYLYIFVGLLLTITISYIAISVMGWSRIETKLVSQGTIKSTINEVKSAGWNLRTISWIDAHGRYCTTLFTNEKGGTLDCDFK